jgi:hypothetical protein
LSWGGPQHGANVPYRCTQALLRRAPSLDGTIVCNSRMPHSAVVLYMLRRSCAYLSGVDT